MTKFILGVTVVQLSRSCLHVQINRVRLSATLFSVSSSYRLFFFYYYYFFFLFGLCFFNTIFLLACFLYSYCWPCWSCTWINIYFNLSPEFYFGKGISKALDLHTGQAYDQIKTIGCQDIPPLKQLNFFQCWLTSWQTTHSTPQTVLIYTQHPPETHWQYLNLPFVHRLNHQYHYPKISTGLVPPTPPPHWFSGFNCRITGVCPVQYWNAVNQPDSNL